MYRFQANGSGSRLFLTRRETRKQSSCAGSQKSFPRHDLSLLFGHCRRNCARRNEGRENVRRRETLDQESRREEGEKGSRGEKTETTGHCLVALGRTSSCCYVTIVYSNPRATLSRIFISSPLRYPLCNRFAFLRRSDPVKQRYRSIIFFSSFQVNGVIPFIPVFRIFNFCLKYNLPNYSLHERVE